uniref:Pre-mRNA-splicing factor cwc15 n=1 Tax=Solanum tuberosum TaxID=4113 RepID=M1C078_SOLTU
MFPLLYDILLQVLKERLKTALFHAALMLMMMQTPKVTMRGLYLVPHLYKNAFSKLLFVQTLECLIVFH